MAISVPLPAPFLLCLGEPLISFPTGLKMFDSYMLVNNTAGDIWPEENTLFFRDLVRRGKDFFLHSTQYRYYLNFGHAPVRTIHQQTKKSRQGGWKKSTSPIHQRPCCLPEFIHSAVWNCHCYDSRYRKDGLPGKRSPDLTPFYSLRHELAVDNSLVMRGIDCLITTSLRCKVVDLAHEGRQGIVHTKQRLRVMLVATHGRICDDQKRHLHGLPIQ